MPRSTKEYKAIERIESGLVWRKRLYILHFLALKVLSLIYSAPYLLTTIKKFGSGLLAWEILLHRPVGVRKPSGPGVGIRNKVSRIPLSRSRKVRDQICGTRNGSSLNEIINEVRVFSGPRNPEHDPETGPKRKLWISILDLWATCFGLSFFYKWIFEDFNIKHTLQFRVNYYYKLGRSDKKYTWSKIVKDKKLQKVPLSEERDNYGVSKSVTRNTKRYQGPIEWHWDENNVSLQTTTSLEFHSHLST